jgi:hypothetical protein
LLALMGIVRQSPLIERQFGEKSKPSDAGRGNPVPVNDHCAADQLAEIVPIEVPAIFEFLHQAHGIEAVARLPEFQHHKAADKRMVERPRGEHAEIVDVTRLVALIAGTDVLGKNLWQRKARKFARREG